MHRWYVAVASLGLLACADQIPTGTPLDLAVRFNTDGTGNESTLLATHMEPELEFPATSSLSKGHARINVLPNGTIESAAFINNISLENVRFGHIHWLPPGAQTGPIIWWLTSPVGTRLNNTDRTMVFRQDAIFVGGGPNPFADHAAALAQLLLHPDQFYVNFHSDASPGGFARGFLGEIGAGDENGQDAP